jgi:hypothetical protein
MGIGTPPEFYRGIAREYRNQADRIGSERLRNEFLALADRWERFAEKLVSEDAAKVRPAASSQC